MDKQQIENLSELYLDKIVQHYGYSNHHNTTPYLCIEDQMYSDGQNKNTKGEYDATLNDLIIYWKNIDSEEELIRVIIHEYQHHLQSPSWMTRYYKLGYTYSDHPYEIQANKQEDNWSKFKINRL